MAAKPLRFSLAAALLAGGLLPSVAGAQNLIGGSVQVNPQALDQLGPPVYGRSSAAPMFGGSARSQGFVPPPIAGRPPLPGEAPAPRPLIGETGNPRTASTRPRPARQASAARPAAISVGEAPARSETPRVETPRSEPAPAAPAPSAASSAPVTTAPLSPAPAAEPPAASTSIPAPAPAPAAQAPAAPAPTPAPVTPAPTAQVPAPAPAPAPAPTPAAPVTVAPQPAPAPAPASPAPAPMPASPQQPPASAAPGNPQTAPQTAMVAPRPTPAPAVQGGLVTIPFSSGQSELPGGNIPALDSLAQQLANSEERLQIRAYAASSGSDGGSGARRLSLSRALAVRAYLIDRGIRSTRIDVRALGTPTDGSAVDRVEVAPVGR